MRGLANRIIHRAVFVAALACAATSQAAVDVFVKLYRADGTTVPGDSIDNYFRGANGWFQISSFSFGVENPIDIAAGAGGAGAGRATFSPLGLAKHVNIVSPALFKAAARGEHFKGVKISIRKAGGAQGTAEPYLEYEFQTVFVSNQQWSHSDGDDQPSETVTFEFGLLRLKFRPTQATGQLGQPIYQAWNVIENTDEFSPLPETPQ